MLLLYGKQHPREKELFWEFFRNSYEVFCKSSIRKTVKCQINLHQNACFQLFFTNNIHQRVACKQANWKTDHLEGTTSETCDDFAELRPEVKHLGDLLKLKTSIFRHL